VHKRILSIAVITVVFFSFIFLSCTKLDTTEIGSDLLPAVDNVHTFDTLLTIVTTQAVFNDSTLIDRTQDHALGSINNDPLFGTTTANIFLQLKPTFYPYYFGGAGDTLNGFGAGIDSVVLCLKYKTFWGDSSLPIHLEVREVNDIKFRDSVFITKTVNYQPNYNGTVIGSTNVYIPKLADTVHYANGRNYSINQIRIKLSAAYAAQLYARDSSNGQPFNKDTLFRVAYNGLAVIANGGGNALIYTNLADTSTKLEVHYRRRNAGKIDSVYSSFILNPSSLPSEINAPSNTTNNIIRNRAGFPVSSPASDVVYLQTTPGTYVNLNIPALSTLSNRIVHRAELIIQQVPDNTFLDDALSAPAYLYVDLKDTGTANTWKPLYFDLNPTQGYNPDSKSGLGYLPSQIDFLYYGGFRRAGPSGNKFYNINITRYVQKVVTEHYHNYEMRLYAPYEIYYPQLGNTTYVASPLLYGNNLAFGRVKLGGGSNTNPNYQMKLRIVYSKL